MSTSRVRGWAGVVLATLGLLLWRAGPGFAVSASAAPGCRDSDACRAVYSEDGSSGAGGTFIRIIVTCEGDCNGSSTCRELSQDNGDGTRSILCSCALVSAPNECSGFARIDSKGVCEEFECIGPCEPENPPTGPPKTCKRVTFGVHQTGDCPVVWGEKRRCDCE